MRVGNNSGARWAFSNRPRRRGRQAWPLRKIVGRTEVETEWGLATRVELECGHLARPTGASRAQRCRQCFHPSTDSEGEAR